jgi:hypothetical protein
MSRPISEKIFLVAMLLVVRYSSVAAQSADSIKISPLEKSAIHVTQTVLDNARLEQPEQLLRAIYPTQSIGIETYKTVLDTVTHESPKTFSTVWLTGSRSSDTLEIRRVRWIQMSVIAILKGKLSVKSDSQLVVLAVAEKDRSVYDRQGSLVQFAATSYPELVVLNPETYAVVARTSLDLLVNSDSAQTQTRDSVAIAAYSLSEAFAIGVTRSHVVGGNVFGGQNITLRESNFKLFVLVDGNLFEIFNLPQGEVTVSDRKTLGLFDLDVKTDAATEMKHYKWSGKAYKEVLKPEKKPKKKK